MVRYLYKSIALSIASASLGRGPPEVRPSTPEPLPGRLRELPGKLGWMNWEPVSLTAPSVGGGGHTFSLLKKGMRREKCLSLNIITVFHSNHHNGNAYGINSAVSCRSAAV